MKNLLIKKLRYLLGFTLIFIGNISFAEKIDIVFGYSSTETPPYQMGNGEDIASPPGIAVDLINDALSDLNANAKFMRFPNNRVMQMLKNK